MSSASAPRVSVPRLERERLAVLAVARDRLQHLGDDHRHVRFFVDPVEQLAQLRLGEEEAEVLVAVHGEPTCRCSASARASRTTTSASSLLVAVVASTTDGSMWCFVSWRRSFKRDVRDDLDVHPRVVVDAHPGDGVHVRHVPPALELGIVVHPLEQLWCSLRLPRTGDVGSSSGGRPGRASAGPALSLRRRPVVQSAPRSPCRSHLPCIPMT